jgi:hypothetical protein
VLCQTLSGGEIAKGIDYTERLKERVPVSSHYNLFIPLTRYKRNKLLSSTIQRGKIDLSLKVKIVWVFEG